ncbi:MAG: hypothetical protein AB2369_07015 [Clostridium sp.]
MFKIKKERFNLKKELFIFKSRFLKPIIFLIIIPIFILALLSPKKYIGSSKNGDIKIEIFKTVEPGGNYYNLFLSQKENVAFNNTPFKFYLGNDDNGEYFSDIREEISKTNEDFYCIIELDNLTQTRVDFKSRPDFFYLFRIISKPEPKNV